MKPSPDNPMGDPIASAFLLEADDVLRQRAKDRDVEQERVMGAIVQTFNAATGHNLTEADGWSFMLVLKLIRSRRGGFKEDDFVDLVSYAALLGECRGKGAQPSAG